MLDDAQYFVMTFIRGPVCRGQVAVDVIEDQFFVSFLDPDRDLSVVDPDFLTRTQVPARAAAEHEGTLLPGELFLAYAHRSARVPERPPGRLRRTRSQTHRSRARLDLGRRRFEHQRPAHRLPELRQRDRRARLRRRDPEDRMGHRLPALRAALLRPGRGLRRLRERHAPGLDAALHGSPAHAGGEPVPRLPAAGAAQDDPRILVRRRDAPARLLLRQSDARPRSRHADRVRVGRREDAADREDPRAHAGRVGSAGYAEPLHEAAVPARRCDARGASGRSASFSDSRRSRARGSPRSRRSRSCACASIRRAHAISSTA